MRTMKNKYIVHSRISEKKFREILKYFAEDIEASKISNLTKISEATLCKIFREIRILISKECEKISKFSGKISSSQARLEASLWNRRKLLLLRFAHNCVLKSYERSEVEQNGAKRVRGKRGRGAANKTPVFLFRYAHSCKQTECLKEMVGFILK